MAMLIARKFARYFEVEARIIPVCKESNYCLDVSKIREHLDENTIGLISKRYH
jgi:glutamate decarboxylase